MSNHNDLSLNIQRFINEDARKRSASAISLDAGLSRDFIRNILNDRSKKPSNKNLESLAKTLGKTLDDLLGPAKAAEVKERADNVLERKRESMKMTDLLVSFHEEIHGKDSHCLLLKNEDIYRTIVNLRNSSRTVKRAEKITLEPLKTRFKSMALDTEIKVIRGKRRLVSGDGSGVWRVTTANGGVLHLGKVNLAKNHHFEFLVGTEKDIIDLKTIISTGSNKLTINPPKKGVWNSAISYIGNHCVHHYIKWNLDKENAKRFDTHPVYDKMKESIDDFFSNIERWTRLGGSGTRKFLMYGPPGTGKTQMLSCLAANISDDIFVVRVADKEEMVLTAKAVAKRKRKTLIICEELDAIKEGCSGDILNFLDGADTPRNEAGTFIVFTTNYPRDIDPRILKRPGRIDKSVKIGPLDNDSVLNVAKMYLPEDANIVDKDLVKALKKTTAAEVKEIINDSISVALSEGIDFDAKLIMKVRSRIKAAMSDNNFRDEDDYPEIREESWSHSKDLEDPMDWLDEEDLEESNKE